jgi:hypothetical protein
VAAGIAAVAVKLPAASVVKLTAPTPAKSCVASWRNAGDSAVPDVEGSHVPLTVTVPPAGTVVGLTAKEGEAAAAAPADHTAMATMDSVTAKRRRMRGWYPHLRKSEGIPREDQACADAPTTGCE